MFSKTLDVSNVLFELNFLRYVPVFSDLDCFAYLLSAG